MKIKVNTQRIHAVNKNTSNNLGLECDNKILGDIYQNISEYVNISEYSDNGMIYYLGYFNTNSLWNKNSFRLHLNTDIETSPLILLLRTFQTRALMLAKVFAPGSTLSS